MFVLTSQGQIQDYSVKWVLVRNEWKSMGVPTKTRKRVCVCVCMHEVHLLHVHGAMKAISASNLPLHPNGGGGRGQRSPWAKWPWRILHLIRKHMQGDETYAAEGEEEESCQPTYTEPVLVLVQSVWVVVLLEAGDETKSGQIGM